MDEKRKDKRFKRKQKVWCEGQEQGEYAEMRNMSRGGMAIISDKAAQEGTKMKVSFTDSKGKPITLDMQVVWQAKTEENEKVSMGLRVVGFNKGQEAFEAFVNEHLTDSLSPQTLDEDPKEEDSNEENTDIDGKDSR